MKTVCVSFKSSNKRKWSIDNKEEEKVNEIQKQKWKSI